MTEKNILEWLEASALKHPDRIVYEDMEESITFAELKSEAECVGSYLAGMELSDKPVAVMMGRSVHTIAAFLGAAYSGHAYAPIDGSQPEARIAKILEKLSPDVLISDGSGEAEGLDFKRLCKDTKVLRYDEIKGCSIDEKALSDIRDCITEDAPLYVIFTSGSSGTPKGVMTSHHSLMNYISAYTEMMEIDEDDRLCSQSPLDYIAAVRDIYVPLLAGAYTCLCPKEYFMQPMALIGLLNEKKVTCLGWSTSALGVLTKLKAFSEGKPKFLKKVCFSGSVMPPAVIREWMRELPETVFVNQYGPTETTASCTYYKIESEVREGEALPIGKPYRNYKVFLLGSGDEAVPEGEFGEICVAGPGLALGYYNDRKLTDAAFIQNPLNSSYRELIYKTGDIGRYNNGCLEFHGRKDRQIKHMGHRVELDEIESASMISEGVSKAAAVYNEEKEALWLFYEGDADKKDVTEVLKEQLPGFMVPRKIKQLDEIPKLPNGKTDMEKLKEMAKGKGVLK